MRGTLTQWVVLVIISFISGYIFGRTKTMNQHFRITDFRQRRRIALRRAAKRYNV